MIFMIFVLIALLILTSVFLFRKRKPTVKDAGLDNLLSSNFLDEHVAFMQELTADERIVFHQKLDDFLACVTITGVDTIVTPEDKLLIAAGAVIPIFRFANWKYYNLKEVLVYSDAINTNFQSVEGTERDILGMVGSGYMEGKMLLSKPALELGFANKSDKRNTVIHEFVHLIDKLDGDTDGVPELLLQKQYVLPWLDMIHKEMEKIRTGESDIDVYGYTNKTEFFAVAAEYFFERPDLFRDKHPQLYGLMQRMFEPPGRISGE
ncbi:MAG: peptidase [Pedobacter sp.]|nr:MAG: peptidase [Pedobacter sp.]